MKKERNTSAEAAELRRRAESRLKALAMKGVPARTEADTQRLVHELQVHQIELEMQNEELRQSRAEVEAGLERYTELYDFAPVGYLTLDRDGAIRQVNLTGAGLLGVARARLQGRRFGVFVGKPDQSVFNAFLERVFSSQAQEVCEVALLQQEKEPLNVHIMATVSQDGQECRVVLMDITKRAQAETALRASEKQNAFQAEMLRNAPVIAAFHDRELNVVWANKAYEDATGLSVQAMAGRKCHSVWGLAKACRNCPVAKAIETGEPYEAELTPQNQDHWPESQGCWLSRATPVRDADGGIIGAIEIAIDITERKRAEDALKESQARLRTIIQTEPECVKLVAPDGTLIEMNAAGLRMIEADSAEACIGKSVYQLVAPAHRAAFQALTEKACAGEEGSLEFEIIGLKGSHRWLNTHAAPLRDARGNIIAALSITRDVTERKRMEDALRESEEIFDSFMEHCPMYVFFKDETTRPIRLSHNYEKMLGRPINDLLGKTMDELFPSELAKGMIEDDLSVIRGGKPIQVVEELNGRIFDTTKFPIILPGKSRLLAGFTIDITERKLAEKALRESEARYRTLTENIPQAVLLKDRESRYISINKAYSIAFGVSQEEVIGKSDYDFHPKQLADKVRQEDRLVMETGENRESEEEDVQEGKKRFYQKVKVPVRDSMGKIIGVLSTLSDITERKLAEERLRASHEIIEGIIDAIPARVFWKDKDLFYLGCNTAFACDAGFADPKDVIGKDDYQMQWRDQAELYRGDDRRIIESGSPKLLIEEPQTTPEGNTITLLTSKIPLRNSKGEICGILGTYLDITERKQAQEALLDSESKYRRLFDSMVEAFIATDMSGRIQETNLAFQTLLGYSEEELKQLCYTDLTPEKWHAFESEIVRNRIIPHGYSDVYDKEYRKKDGTTFPVELRTFLLRDVSGQPAGMWALIRDITERKRAEQEQEKLQAQLRQAQKMEAVGRLSGGVAHDFNNMLSVILGFTELAIMKLPADDPVRLYLDEVKTAAQRSADITRQLLAFARKQIIAPRILDLNDTIAGMLKMLSRLIGEDIDLLWKPSKDLWPVKMDPAQVDQVLANLVVNARDAIIGVGKITIETGKTELDEHYCEAHPGCVPGRYVLLAVSDNGCGMGKDILAKLFEPFFTTKEAGKGTGLGLATIYGIVKQNNGFINVYSEPGQGTTFKIYLPRQEPLEAATEPPRKPAKAPTGKETVLLVEDETSLLTFARMLLEELGYTVLAAGNPKEAIRLAQEYTREIHLLLTDVVMPEMSGRDLCVQLEASRPGLKCLFMSGYTADVIAHQGVLDEGVHFLQKPFSREALAAKAREALS